MNSSLIQLLVLAGIAIFLILKLRSVLGTREGFEKPPLPPEANAPVNRRGLEVVQGGLDRDIHDQTTDPATAAALTAMKGAEPAFNVADFLKGARGAYEMILMAYEKGEIDGIRAFLADEVESGFDAAIEQRHTQGLTLESTFAGIRDMALTGASYDATSKLAEVTVRFTGELTRTVRDKSGTVVEGSPTQIQKQRDTWTFGRRLGSGDPNWQLTATGE